MNFHHYISKNYFLKYFLDKFNHINLIYFFKHHSFNILIKAIFHLIYIFNLLYLKFQKILFHHLIRNLLNNIQFNLLFTLNIIKYLLIYNRSYIK